MIDTVAVQVHEATRDLTGELESICRGKDFVLNHFTDIKPVKKFKHQERRAIARKKVRVDDLHHVLVRWEVSVRCDIPS